MEVYILGRCTRITPFQWVIKGVYSTIEQADADALDGLDVIMGPAIINTLIPESLPHYSKE